MSDRWPHATYARTKEVKSALTELIASTGKNLPGGVNEDLVAKANTEDILDCAQAVVDNAKHWKEAAADYPGLETGFGIFWKHAGSALNPRRERE